MLDVQKQIVLMEPMYIFELSKFSFFQSTVNTVDR